MRSLDIEVVFLLLKDISDTGQVLDVINSSYVTDRVKTFCTVLYVKKEGTGEAL